MAVALQFLVIRLKSYFPLLRRVKSLFSRLEMLGVVSMGDTEVKIPRLTIPASKNWDEWHRLIQNELRKHVEMVDSQIAKLEKLQQAKQKDDNYSIFVSGLSSIFTQVNATNVLVTDILTFDDELRKHVRSLEQKIDKLSNDLKSSSPRFL